MTTPTRVRELLREGAHVEGGFLTTGFQVQHRHAQGAVVLVYDAEAVSGVRPDVLERHLPQYAATLIAAGLQATRHEHYLLVSDLGGVPSMAQPRRGRPRDACSLDVRAIAAAEVEQCIQALLAALDLDPARLTSTISDLVLQLRYPAVPYAVSFSTPVELLAFVDLVRQAPTAEAALRRYVRQAMTTSLRRMCLHRPGGLDWDTMIAALTALDDA